MMLNMEECRTCPTRDGGGVGVTDDLIQTRIGWNAVPRFNHTPCCNPLLLYPLVLVQVQVPVSNLQHLEIQATVSDHHFVGDVNIEELD